jgi:hypothetical protein
MNKSKLKLIFLGSLDSFVDVGNLTSYTIWTLQIRQMYFFAVDVHNDKGERSPSEIISAVVR